MWLAGAATYLWVGWLVSPSFTCQTMNKDDNIFQPPAVGAAAAAGDGSKVYIRQVWFRRPHTVEVHMVHQGAVINTSQS